MKTILLVRHAKSSWENFAVKDVDRPLNDRGHRDAPMMARRLLDRKIHIDRILTSHALRARATADYFAAAHGIKPAAIQVSQPLYHAGFDDFVAVIRSADPSASSIAIFSHNNGITLFANALSDARIDDMPTCAVFAVQCDIDSWSDFEPSGNRFYFFDYPKAV